MFSESLKGYLTHSLLIISSAIAFAACDRPEYSGSLPLDQDAGMIGNDGTYGTEEDVREESEEGDRAPASNREQGDSNTQKVDAHLNVEDERP